MIMTIQQVRHFGVEALKLNKQLQRTVKPVTQIAAQLRASFACRCAGRYLHRNFHPKLTS